MYQNNLAKDGAGMVVPAAVSAPQRVQAKLTIGAANDPMEREAEALADNVMRMPAPALLPPGSVSSAEGAQLNRKPLISFIQKKSNEAGTEASEGVSQKVNASRGLGDRLDTPTRSFMESRFGADFSQVNIHTGSDAVALSQELNAQAFTVGNDIYFNQGKYNPSSPEGKHLLAHELTHTVQQGGDQGLQRSLIQRDVAVEPTVANPVAAVLTAAQIRAAIRWNQVVFTDADEIALIRDIIGLPEQPAVVDEDFVQLIAQYQADYGLTQDGKVGAGTANRLANELRAEAADMGAEADTGTVSEMALNPAERRMRLRSRIVGRLGSIRQQGFTGTHNHPGGVVTTRTGFAIPGDATHTNAIGINYTGSNADNSRWIQFTFSQMSAVDPDTNRRVYNAGSITTSGGTYNYSNATTFNWHTDSIPASGSMYYETGGANERVAGAHTEIFDQPGGWNGPAETYAASFATRPTAVRLIKGFDTYLVVNNNSVVYHVRWNQYFNFNSTTAPTPDVPGSYEVLSSGSVSRLPAALKTVLDAEFAGNTVP